MEELLGGEVKVASQREFGNTEVEILDDSNLFQGLKKGQRVRVWASHGDMVSSLPPDFVNAGRS